MKPLRLAHAPWRQRGFTLLELLLVVSILSGVAMLAFATASDVDAQRRYEDTQQRLLAIRRAVVGVSEPVWDGQVRLSGFSADNGLLPTILDDLATQPSGYAASAARQAVFDTQPDANCLSNDAVPTTVPGDANKLVKGWRSRYLPASPGASQFRDGWGNHSTTGDDASNFGWSVSASADSLGVTSLAQDNASGGGSDFDLDVTEQVTASQWRVDLNGWQVQVTNHSTVTLPLSGSLRVSVLAFVNDASGGKWKRVTSAPIAGIAATSSALASFSGYCDNGSAGNSWLPQGRHLVVLVSDTDGAAHNGASETLTDADSAAAGIQLASRQAAFFAGADRPTVTLDLK